MHGYPVRQYALHTEGSAVERAKLYYIRPRQQDLEGDFVHLRQKVCLSDTTSTLSGKTPEKAIYPKLTRLVS